MHNWNSVSGSPESLQIEKWPDCGCMNSMDFIPDCNSTTEQDLIFWSSDEVESRWAVSLSKSRSPLILYPADELLSLDVFNRRILFPGQFAGTFFLLSCNDFLKYFQGIWKFQAMIINLFITSANFLHYYNPNIWCHLTQIATAIKYLDSHPVAAGSNQLVSNPNTTVTGLPLTPHGPRIINEQPV